MGSFQHVSNELSGCMKAEVSHFRIALRDKEFRGRREYRPSTLHTLCISGVPSGPYGLCKPTQSACHCTEATDFPSQLPRTVMLRSAAILPYIPLMYSGDMRNGQTLSGQTGLVENSEVGGQGKASSVGTSLRGLGITEVIDWLLVPVFV